MNHLFEDKIAHMQTGKMSPYSNSTRRGPTSGLDCPETASLPRDSASTTRTVVIGLKANEKLRFEIFGHSRNYLGNLTNSRLVVVDCVSKLRDEFGFNRMFAGANERKLAAKLKKQNTDLNFILNSLRKKLEQGGCGFEILTRPGRASADILIQTSKALNPHLVLLELSFAKDRKRIQRELQCNVALMKMNPLETPQIFEFTPKYPGPIDSLHDRDSQESDNPSESTVDPEALDSNPEITPSRLPFHKDVPISSSFIFALKRFFVKDKVKARKEIEDLQKKEHSSRPDALMKVPSGLLILKEMVNLKTAEFITEINNGRDSGYFVSKAWMLSLDEHEDQALTSVLRQTGYLEIYQTDTTVFYEKINEAVQVSNSCNENIDLGGGDTNKVVASSDNEHKIRDIKKHFHQFHLASQLKRSDFVDPEGSTSSFQNRMQSVPVQNDQTAFVDSPKSLLDKGKMPLATSNERLESFKRAINDTSLDNYSVSTQWISTLSDQERENLNFALSKAGYLQIDRTSVTTYFERLQGHVRKNPNNSSERSSTLQNTSIVGGAESSRQFEGSGGLLADDWQRPKIDNKGSSAVTTAIRERHKQEMTCSCHPQHLTVSCKPEPSPSSSSQGEYVSKYSTRQAVGDSHVTIPRKREVQLVRTGADKRISMGTVHCCGLSDYKEVSISLEVSAYTSFTCCLKCDSDDKKVRIEFSTIGGEVKVEDNVNPKTNTVVLRSVRCNVDACIIHSEGTDDFEPIQLYVQESDGQGQWRRVLQTYELFDDNGQPIRPDDLLWMKLAENHPKNSEYGSRTLELQCDVKNRIHYDLVRCCHDAHALEFAERDPVILEGDIFEDLKSNMLLELNVRYQVVISYNEPRLPKRGQKFVATTRVDKTLDFDCVLEFRTRELPALENVYFHDLEGSYVLGPREGR